MMRPIDPPNDPAPKAGTDLEEEYLWDPNAAPDPEIRQFEKLLTLHRYHPETAPVWQRARGRSSRGLWLLAAALIVAGFGWTWMKTATTPGYLVTGLAGVDRVGPGDRLETNASSAQIAVGDIGRVELLPGSRLRVEDCGEENHRLFLELGTLRATILAEPRVFLVGTPAALTVDLGCEYDLTVDEAGDSHLAVRTGRVAFEGDGRSVLVPAGASCFAAQGEGPGTPVFESSPADFAAAVRAVEFEEEPDPLDVSRLLALADRPESLSLWHLLEATPSVGFRERIFDRLAITHPLPEGVSRDGIILGDAAMRGAWRAVIERDWR